MRQCVREKTPLPDPIANAPELAPGLEPYFGAFFDLTTCRSTGWTEGPIPWTAVHFYAEAHNFEGEEREDLFYHVRAMDDAFLKWARDRRPSNG
jgi:hypothetical protein